MAEYDLLPKIAPYLDKHLLLPLLDNVHKQKIYPEEQVLKYQLELLKKTKLVDFAMDKYKELNKNDLVPEGVFATSLPSHVDRITRDS